MKTKKKIATKSQVYKTKDLVVPTLTFKNPTPISISINDKEVSLQIGPRDIQWDRKTGEVVGSGCFLG